MELTLKQGLLSALFLYTAAFPISGHSETEKTISANDERLAERVVLMVRGRCLDDALRYIPGDCRDCRPTKSQIEKRLQIMDQCFEDWLNHKWNLVQDSRNSSLNR